MFFSWYLFLHCVTFNITAHEYCVFIYSSCFELNNSVESTVSKKPPLTKRSLILHFSIYFSLQIKTQAKERAAVGLIGY